MPLIGLSLSRALTPYFCVQTVVVLPMVAYGRRLTNEAPGGTSTRRILAGSPHCKVVIYFICLRQRIRHLSVLSGVIINSTHTHNSITSQSDYIIYVHDSLLTTVSKPNILSCRVPCAKPQCRVQAVCKSGSGRSSAALHVLP